MNINGQEILEQLLSVYTHPGVIVGIGIEVVLFILLMVGYKKFNKSGIVVFFDAIYEMIYEFFEDIVGREEKRWIKMYIVSMFFIILFSNLLGVFLEILIPIFGKDAHGHDILHHYVSIPTADINFNIAMAVVGVFIVIVEQFKFLGLKKGLYEYFPVFGKDYIPYERGTKPAYIDWPLFLLVKVFDIIISVFLGVLEIVGHGAKIVSLAFRLFGNMTSGGLLLGMLMVGVSGLTVAVSGIEFPVVAPIIVYLQEILVALIQALVFPLLVGIFIKVAKTH